MLNLTYLCTGKNKHSSPNSNTKHFQYNINHHLPFTHCIAKRGKYSLKLFENTHFSNQIYYFLEKIILIMFMDQITFPLMTTTESATLQLLQH